MTGTPVPDVSVVVVSFNTRDLLRECLCTLAAEAGGVRYETIVVDNASRDRSAEMVAAEFPDAVLIPLRDQMRWNAELSDLSLSLRQADQLSKIHLLVKANVLEQDDPLLLLDQDPKIMACYQEMLTTKE